jgi:hypothetical protein
LNFINQPRTTPVPTFILNVYLKELNSVKNDLTYAKIALDFIKKCTEIVQKLGITKETLQN